MLLLRKHVQAESVAARIPGKHVTVTPFFDLNGKPVEPHRLSKRCRKAHIDVIIDGLDPDTNARVDVGLAHIGAEQLCVVAERP